MFEYFEDNYMWSAALNLALMAGGDMGQIDRFLRPLRTHKATTEEWTNAWNAMGDQQKQLAKAEVDRGYLQSAANRYLRASIYHITADRQTPPGDAKMHSYTSGLKAFEDFRALSRRPIKRVEIPSPDGILPGYLVLANDTSKPSPVVIFYNGFDVTKEYLYGIITDNFASRGIACLMVDTPGTGEPLRLRGVPSRPDYEVPTAAVVDFIESVKELDKNRIGLLGISLGGYYAPRGAAFEPRIKACVAWGAIYDYGETWRKRWETQSKMTPVPQWQLCWVMGRATMAEAVERTQAWKLAEALPHLKQPFLIVHGENDTAITLPDAQRAYDEAASTDKELKVFSIEEGGSEHVGLDDPDPSRQLICDWFAEKLGMLRNLA